MAAILEFKMAATKLIESLVSRYFLKENDQQYYYAKFHTFITFWTIFTLSSLVSAFIFICSVEKYLTADGKLPLADC